MNDKNNNFLSNIGFTGLLQLSFIVLKLCGIINWTWWWVLSPTWICILLVIAIILIIAILS